MNRVITLVLISTLMISSAYAEKVLRGAEANKEAQGAEVIRFKDNRSIPAYIKFRETERISYDTWQNWIGEKFFKEEKDLTFQLIGKEVDKLGMNHFRYQQIKSGIPIEFGVWIVHEKNGKVLSMNGELYNTFPESELILNEEEALSKALQFVNADVYKWEIPKEEEHLKLEENNPNATYFPAGHLSMVNPDPSFKDLTLRTSWKFNIYAQSPLSRTEVFIDASNGEVIFTNDLIHHADSNGIANTGHSGTRAIVADYTGSDFRLREAGRGNGIQTFNMNQGTNYGNSTDFTDNDNNWTSTSLDQFATDAHWGAEMTYDFYWNSFNRNSIDDNGFLLRSYVHYDQNFGNAFWDGQRMTYGDGNNGSNPFTALDITGHEITHGLTNFTADLIYQNESGALNESFSDIFGAAVEFDALGVSNGDWTMGEDLGFIIRFMNNPNLGNDPDTYEGNNWVFGNAVHTNSGVQNFWYYLLSTGGSGVNDNGDSYTVAPIGLTDANAIAFRNLTVYLVNSSQYEDARFYALESAIDLFGPCSQQLASTGMAWYAVGVGQPYPITVISEFESSSNSSCNLPYSVSFSNFSSNGSNYLWDFGDGSTSTQTSPVHTYTQQGIFDVSLQVTSTCGSDTELKTGYITIEKPDGPIGFSADICPGETATLIAQASNEITWFNTPVGGSPLQIGDTFTTGVINTTSIFYAETTLPGSTQAVGPADNNFGTGGNFNSFQYQVFDVMSAATIESVKVFASGSGVREIELRDNNGNQIETASVTMVNGEQVVPLNFDVEPGTDYQLGVTANSQIGMYRNSSGANYPYEINGVLSITRSSANTDPFGYYYFYYDWIVSERCVTDRTPVTASVDICTGVSEINRINFSIYPNPSDGIFTLEAEEFNLGTKVKIVNASGQNVFNSVLTSGQTQIEAKLPAGVYFVSLLQKEHVTTKRLVIK